jgi:DNA-binding XRE family transcriptional regulator
MDQGRIGNFIKDLRKEKGLTQEQLAEQFAVSRRTVSRWETAATCRIWTCSMRILGRE